MGMSTHVVGFKPPDEKWQRMRAVWDACAGAGIKIPHEVEKYFDGGPPDSNGVEIDERRLRDAGCLREWSDEYARGFEVDVANLPKDVTVIRFYNAW